MKKLIVANWKAAPESLAEARELVSGIEEVFSALPDRERIGLILCPPFLYLEEIASLLGTSSLTESVVLGAQDIALDDSPSQTGEISGAMLKKVGVRYVIVGHSERRWKLEESDEVVSRKLREVLASELTPIVCIGERSRDGAWQEEIVAQVRATFNGLPPEQVARCLIAYEPVWAISTTPGAHPDTPESALQALTVIRGVLHGALSQRFLYGGSITSQNAGAFLALPEFGGVLVGGASVRREEFAKILNSATRISS